MLLTAISALLLLLAANGAPVLGKRLLGEHLSAPLDGGRRFLDARPLFGRSKTWRGLTLSLGATALVAPLLGYTWTLGMTFAACSMAGDLLTSFIKRRLNIPPSGRFLGLDQIPEAALPLLVFRAQLGLDLLDVAALTGLFTVGSLLLSRVMYRLGIRDRPY
ncbi:MAG: CDP-archaeol synthase [Pseudomonadales bacterium]